MRLKKDNGYDLSSLSPILKKDNGYDLSFLSSITPFYYGYRHHIFNYGFSTSSTVQDYCNPYGSFYGYKISHSDKRFYI